MEVIIVDTSGRHRQETELFEEMEKIGEAVSPVRWFAWRLRAWASARTVWRTDQSFPTLC